MVCEPPGRQDRKEVREKEGFCVTEEKVPLGTFSVGSWPSRMKPETEDVGPRSMHETCYVGF
jgi:hypothetical protein